MRKILLGAWLLALCGCCSVTICQEGGKEMVKVENESFRLFGCLAFWSGDPEYPNRSVTLWFCDSLLLDVNMMMLDDVMRQKGYASFRNISTYRERENMFLFFSRDKLHTSAELIR